MNPEAAWKERYPTGAPLTTLLRHGWVQLVAGIIAMVAITNLQYGWTFFVEPIDRQLNLGREAIQVAFTLFVLAETWLVPVEGYLADRLGPSLPVAAGGGMIAAAWRPA